MNNEKTIISLEILFLNDLFRTKVIDKRIYDLAVQKIESIKKPDQIISQPKVLSIA